MAAADHLHPGQMKMFMSPNEMLGGAVTYANDVWDKSGSGPSPFTAEAVASHPAWQRKRLVVEQDPTFKSIASEGVHEPLHIFHDTPAAKVNRGLAADDPRGMLRNGHHRFLAQYLSDPDKLMPVVHEDH